jgi:hypothetical protein
MMKLLEENLRENCSKIRFSNDFWATMPKTQGAKVKTDKLDYIEVKKPNTFGD